MIDLSLSDLFGEPVAFDAATRSTMAPAEQVLRPVRENLGIEAEYRRQLQKLIDEMAKSVAFWVKGAFKRAPSEVVELAQDELASTALKDAIRRLTVRWTKRFDDGAKRLAAYFAKTVSRRTDAELKSILKDAGFAIDWKMSPSQRDIINAVVNENVSLIKSIPSQYFTQVEGIVMRSVARGGDLKQLTDDLQHQFGVTRRRAAFIARDQNSKANGALSRARMLEVGIDEAIWCHSHGGHEPRPSHVKAGRDKQRFDLRKGWFDPDAKEWIIPGQLIGCKCFSRPVLRR